jgi:hypothetical protein
MQRVLLKQSMVKGICRETPWVSSTGCLCLAVKHLPSGNKAETGAEQITSYADLSSSVAAGIR